MKISSHLLQKGLLTVICVTLLSCCSGDTTVSPPAMIKVSSDGQYVISTHYGRYLFLWDLKNRTKKLISKKANIFSPHFINGSHRFIWQDAETNMINLESIEGEKRVLMNLGIQVYGHMITPDLQQYLFSDENWRLYRINQWQSSYIKKSYSHSKGAARLLNMVSVGEQLLTSGFESGYDFPLVLGGVTQDINPQILDGASRSMLAGIVLWDTITGRPVHRYLGNVGMTMADLSPDANYVVGVDENGLAFTWQVRAGKRQDIMNPINPDFSCFSQDCKEQLAYNIKTNVPMPADFYSHPNANGPKSVAVKFIDEQGHFIRFIETANYATLHHISTPKVQAYMPFGKKPQPHVFSPFSSANVIDTAPKAKILVMAQTSIGMPKGKGTGIIVYQFDEKSKTLKRLWAPEGPPPHRRITNKDNPWEG